MKSQLRRNAALLTLLLGALPFTVSASDIYCGTSLCGDLTNADGTITADDSQIDVGNVGGTNTNGNVSGSISYFPSPSLDITSMSTGTSDSTTDTGNSEATWFFTVGSLTPQSSPASIPIEVTGSYLLTSEVSPFASASAIVSLAAFGAGASLVENLSSCTSPSCTNSSSFVLAGNVTAGTVVEMYMSGSVFTQANPNYEDSSASAKAILDPVIEIDPSFKDASDYTVLVSPAIGNVSAVPEPGAAWLMLSGLGSLGLLGRKRLIRA